MQAANRLQRALRTGSGLTFGAWQMLPGTNHARVMARCGFDWICVDTEHGNIDGMNETPIASAAADFANVISSVGSAAAMHEAVAAVAACGVSPVVRIPANEGWMVKRKRAMLLYLSARALGAPHIADNYSVQEP